MQSHLPAFIQPINSDEHVQTNTATPLHTCMHKCSCVRAHKLLVNVCMHRYTWNARRGLHKQKTSRESGDQRCRVQTGVGVSQKTHVKTPNRALIISRLSFIPDSLYRSVSPSLSFSFCYCLWDAGVKNHIFPTVLPEVLLADTQRKDASSFYIALVLSFLLLSPLSLFFKTLSVSLWCGCHRGQVYMQADLARCCQLVNHNDKKQ